MQKVINEVETKDVSFRRLILRQLQKKNDQISRLLEEEAKKRGKTK